jgi:hypothetical protein
MDKLKKWHKVFDTGLMTSTNKLLIFSDLFIYTW